MPKYNYVIGLDGGTYMGYAVWSARDRAFIELKTITFWDFFIGRTYRDSEEVGIVFDYFPDDTLYVIEDPAQHPTTFAHNERNAKKREKISRNAGGVLRESRLLIEGCRRLCFDVLPIVPSTGKWNTELFKKITGYKHTCSQHARDAAKLVYQLNKLSPVAEKLILPGY